MSFKVDTNFGVNTMMNVYSSFLLNLSSSTSLSSFMLVPFSFRKAKLISHLHHQHFIVLSIEDYRPTDGLVLLKASCKLKRIHFDEI